MLKLTLICVTFFRFIVHCEKCELDYFLIKFQFKIRLYKRDYQYCDYFPRLKFNYKYLKRLYRHNSTLKLSQQDDSKIDPKSHNECKIFGKINYSEDYLYNVDTRKG